MSTSLKIAVHCNQHYQDSYAPRWIDELKSHGVEVLAVDFHDSDIINKVRGCDGVMWHWFHTPDDKQAAPKILQAIELGLGIPVFPNMFTGWHYDEKVAQHYLMDAINAPKIKSWVFWRYEDALKFIQNCSYPVVFKLSVGAGSSNVLKLNSQSEALQVLGKIFLRGFFPYTINEFTPSTIPKNRIDLVNMKQRASEALRYTLAQEYPSLPWHYLVQKNYAYFQEFIPDNPFDIRITVIGNRAFSFVRYNRPNDFRASGSGCIDYDLSKIPLEAVAIAHRISKQNKFQSMAYDFLYSKEKQTLINEISYCYMNKAVYDCPGYWDRNLTWHEGHIWPEEAHVEDFIHYIKNGELP